MQTTANKVQDDKILDASADAAGGKEVRVRMQMVCCVVGMIR